MENTQPQILLVEDDPALQNSIIEILESQNHFVAIAKTGHEAIEKTQKKFFNIVLLDIKLPDMDGIDVLSEIHKLNPEMKKMIITGYPSIDNSIKALNLGADAYLIKPVKPNLLLSKINELLKKQKEIEEMTEKEVSNWIKKRVRQIETADK